MQCPKCKQYMKAIVYEGIEVNRCTNCYGLWFDSFEQEDLKKLSGAEVIDIADVDIGRKQNLKTEIRCPVDHVEMIQETDRQQAHIQFERCPECQGVYFDSGEFRDYKNFTIGEFFRYYFRKGD
ncbi:zf-TFIIB domain-containing protein [bacterium]|nr:zf-TFIIB domain-containing protein [bacterium]